MRYVVRLVVAISCVPGLVLLAGGTARADAGADCIQTADPDRQIRGCTQLLRQTPRNKSLRADIYVDRAWAYANKGDNDQAIADATKAIEINPRFGAWPC